MSAIATLRTWADSGRRHRATRPKKRANWAAVDRLINAARPKLAEDGRELKKLLDESRHQMAPFDDPFDIDLGMHRWLAEDREEAYSDWLQWIVEQLRSPALVYRMFSRTPPDDFPAWPDNLNVKREHSVESGHDGRAGRIDLVVRYPGHALIVVEVKTGRADEADTLKQKGYRKWADDEPEPDRHKVLLCTSAQKEEYEGFLPYRWCQVCVFLRRLIAEKPGKRNHTTTALMLAFVGAVEQNLLRMKVRQIRQVAEGKSILFDQHILDHLRASVKRGL